MTLRFVIEHTPHPQPRAEFLHLGGEFSVGRGTDADWQLVDPDMFVSRRHCVVSGRDGDWRVTDASRGGLFIDGATTPLGAGMSAPLEHGMRLRLGDIVIRVEVVGAEDRAAPPPQARRGGDAGSLAADDFFSVRPPPEPRVERPANLPESFDSPRSPAKVEPPERRNTPPPFDDPFMLDPLPARVAPPPAGGGFFDLPGEQAPPPDSLRAPREERVVERRPAAASLQEDIQVAGPSTDDALWQAFLRGLGLPPARVPARATEQDMEEIGRRFRALTDGLVMLLRARALEKQNVRVAQTVIGRADVNPLKFLPSVEEAVAALIAPKGEGYLPPDEAIAGAFQDLTDHQARAWRAMQAALRRMIDRFDPAEFEKAVAADGMLQTLLAGGRGARLWQLYAERYGEIAKGAEERFLGDVGADFRDAYEANGRKER